MSKNEVNEEARKMGAMSHISPLLGLVMPFGSLLGPFLFYLVYKERSVFVKNHSAEAFNFQLTISIGLLILWVVGITLIVAKLGFLINWVVEWYNNPAAFQIPEWPVIGGWVVAAVITLFLSLLLVIVLTVWNLVEIIMACSRAWHGQPARYSFVIRPIKVDWKN